MKLRLVGQEGEPVRRRRARSGFVSTGEDGQPRDIFRTVNSGGSFGASSLRPHIGLGKATAIETIEIRWPGSGGVQQFRGPFAADLTYEAREDRADLAVVQPPARRVAATSR